jgi:RimJ/RimL family protein N-acetyltransferase
VADAVDIDLPLHTDRLELRAFRVGDLDAFLAYRGREDVSRYLLHEPLDRVAAAARLQQAIASVRLEKEGDHLDLAMVRRDTGELIGDVLLMHRSDEHRNVELGFSVHPDHHGQGFAREAAERMLQAAFEHFGYHRVFGRCDARNDASSGLMRRLGLRQEAHFVRNEWVKGEWCDELHFALLEDEWATMHP